MQVIEEFTSQRAAAQQSNRVPKPRVEQFIERFEHEMVITEEAHRQLKASKKRAYQQRRLDLNQASSNN